MTIKYLWMCSMAFPFRPFFLSRRFGSQVLHPRWHAAQAKAQSVDLKAINLSADVHGMLRVRPSVTCFNKWSKSIESNLPRAAFAHPLGNWWIPAQLLFVDIMSICENKSTDPMVLFQLCWTKGAFSAHSFKAVESQHRAKPLSSSLVRSSSTVALSHPRWHAAQADSNQIVAAFFCIIKLFHHSTSFGPISIWNQVIRIVRKVFRQHRLQQRRREASRTSGRKTARLIGLPPL